MCVVDHDMHTNTPMLNTLEYSLHGYSSLMTVTVQNVQYMHLVVLSQWLWMSTAVVAVMLVSPNVSEWAGTC